jgi:peptidyl-prolyl cis-trans isomerase SurA
MRRATLPLFAVLLAWPAVARAEIIDRVAVAVGNRVITQSEVERHARLTAFLNQEQPDLSPAARRKTAERLVEQRLVRRELEASRYPPPSATEVDAVLQGVKEQFGAAGTLNEALAKYGVTEQHLREHLLWQLQFLRFIDIRFRPGVQVSEEDAREYYEKTVLPAAAGANPGKTPSFEDYRETIEEALTGRRVDEELERWLQAARRRTRVEFREGAFR